MLEELDTAVITPWSVCGVMLNFWRCVMLVCASAGVLCCCGCIGVVIVVCVVVVEQ